MTTKNCVMCGSEVPARSRGVTCNSVCSARFRERSRTPEWSRPPKVYPAEMVERVRHLYLDEGMSQIEVAAELGTTLKVIYRLMLNHEIPRRKQIKRHQSGPANDSWRGDGAGYKALHLRVSSQRGKPSLCAWCGKTDGRFEWANISGDYHDIYDYERLCASCHRNYDAARRRATGLPTSLVRRPA